MGYLVAYYIYENKEINKERKFDMIFNIFCDASIDLATKIACGGCYIMTQDQIGRVEEFGFKRIIQKDATNNSAEILAIWIGVVEALKIRQLYPGAIFRLFSDSKISLYGVRDWMKNWVSNINSDGVLISSSGQPVMNQQRFIEIFNLIVENNLKIEFYHQRGHVEERHMPLTIARAQFIKANKVSPEGMDTSIEILCHGNAVIDALTRKAVYSYIGGELLPNTEVEAESPFIYYIRKSMLHQYIRCIDKTTVRSRHDFKGGYNQ